MIWILVVLIFSLLAYGLLGVYGVLGKTKKKELNYLKENGKIIEAEITDIKSYTAASLQGIPAIYARIVARSIVHRKPQEFKSERIYPNKCILEVGDKVKILVNIKNPKQYYFDPYQKEY
jgi:MinD-like ATPase involved in chromosome partitioning or flagellar assembly